jgi:hypothetical protein
MTYCSFRGFKQEVICSLGRPKNASAYSSYVTFQTCPYLPGDTAKVYKFELGMLLMFILSFIFLTRRKGKQRKLQEERIAEYMDV